MPRIKDFENRKRQAYLMHKSGETVPDIATQLEVSERMVYRYIDAFELQQLRAWKERFEEALSVTPLESPVSQLLKIIKARK